MLTLTENAATIVTAIADQQGSEVTGLRITAGDQPEDSFAVATATGPEPDDQVLEQDGAQIYLDSPAAAQLDDKVLDAGVDTAGNVEFALGVQD